MIVKCERCQTRFKIPDEKVTDKGVKVRCTKCQHTFRVVREDASSATPAPASTPPAVAAPTAAATPRSGTPLEAPAPRAPAPGPAAAMPWSNASPAAPSGPGVAFPRGGTPATPTSLPRSSVESPKTPGTMDLDPLMEFIGDNSPTPAQALQLAAKAPLPGKPAGALAMGPSQPAAPAKAPASPKPAMTPKPALAAPVRSAPPAPKPAPSPVPVPAKSAAPAPAPRSSAPVSFEENDPFALPQNDPFSLPADNAPTVPATPTLTRSSAPASFDANDPFALPPDSGEMDGLEGNNPFVSFDAAPTVPATPTLPPAPAPKPARSAAPAPAPLPAPDSGEMEGLEGNNPFVSFDPVAALPPAARNAAPAPSPAPSAIPDWGAPQQAAPSAIPDWGAPQQAAPSAIPDWGAPQQAAPSAIPDWGATQTVAATPVAKAAAPTERNPFPLPDFPGPGGATPGREILPDLPAMTPTPAPAPQVVAAPPAKKPESSGGPPLVRRLAGVAAQLVVGAVLVVGLVALGSAWLNDGRMDPREMLSPAHRPLVAKELSNGLYETRAGQSLFYVRGEVENRGTAPVRVKAQVAIYDGDQRVKSAEGLAGAVPTPEELYSLEKPADADALRTRLDAAAREVAPGARAPFVVLFYEYPSDLRGFRLEVTLEPQGAGTATGGAKEGTAGNAQP